MVFWENREGVAGVGRPVLVLSRFPPANRGAKGMEQDGVQDLVPQPISYPVSLFNLQGMGEREGRERKSGEMES